MSERTKFTPVGLDMGPTRVHPSSTLLSVARKLGEKLRRTYGMNSSCGFGSSTQAVSHPSIERITSPTFDVQGADYEHPHASFLRAQEVGLEEEEYFIRAAHARRIYRRIGRFPTTEEKQRLGFKVLDEDYDPSLPAKEDFA